MSPIKGSLVVFCGRDCDGIGSLGRWDFLERYMVYMDVLLLKSRGFERDDVFMDIETPVD